MSTKQPQKIFKIKPEVKLSRKEKAKKWWADTIHKLENEKIENALIKEEDICKSFSPIFQEFLIAVLLDDDKLKLPLVQCTKKKKKVRRITDENQEFEFNSVKAHGSDSIEEIPMMRSEYETLHSHSDTILDMTTVIGSQLIHFTEVANVDADSVKTTSAYNKRMGIRDQFDFEAFRELEIERTKHPEERYWAVFKSYFEKDPVQAAIWKPQSPPTFENMTLEQKANAVTYQIATEFIDWMQSLSDGNKINLNVENIIKMFDIGGQSNLAKTLDMCLTEQISIAPNLAKFKKQPNKSRIEILNNERTLDIEASKLKPKIFAFGSRLPAVEQIRPVYNDFTANRKATMDAYENLLTMETIFNGIEDLTSTTGYIKYLKTIPGLVPPSYLVDKGLMSKESLDSNLSEEFLDI